jgi:hypothetical protein
MDNQTTARSYKWRNEMSEFIDQLQTGKKGGRKIVIT